MRSILYVSLASGLWICGANAQTQSLGDYARAAKKTKPKDSAPKVYDNDNLPNNATLSVVGDTAAGSDKDKDEQAKSDDKNIPEKKSENSQHMKAGQSAEEREKAIGEWKQKIDDQKGKVSLLSRELDVLQRERQIKQADFYASTARAVQNARGFDEEDGKYKKQIADKQKELDEAKSKLNDLEEQARKAGAPNSIAE